MGIMVYIPYYGYCRIYIISRTPWSLGFGAIVFEGSGFTGLGFRACLDTRNTLVV